MKTGVFIPRKMDNEWIQKKNARCFEDGMSLIYFILKTFLKAEDVDEAFVISWTGIKFGGVA